MQLNTVFCSKTYYMLQSGYYPCILSLFYSVLTKEKRPYTVKYMAAQGSSLEIAKLHAETEFEKYRVIQDRLFMSDFDKFMLELEESAKK